MASGTRQGRYVLADMKSRILDAALRIIASKGLAFATTKEISNEAGCAEGSIYTHYHNRAELLLAVFRAKLPQFSEALNGLAFRVGEATIEETLKELFLVFLPFYRQTAPLMGSLFSDLDLLRDYQKTLGDSKSGPHTSQNHLIAYLKAEQRLGRVSAKADIVFLAEIMLGACFQRAFRETFMESPGRKAKASSNNDLEFSKSLARAMSTVLQSG